MSAPERYGSRKVAKMYAEINALRQAIQAEGTPAIQDAWDKVVQHIEFAYRGCPECRATEAAPGIPGYSREEVQAVVRSLSLWALVREGDEGSDKGSRLLTEATVMLRAAVGEMP